ncbi:MAG: SUF system NifU family Fe-S cluster assembly protein [Oligoflexia bacterium]|nr:SUF system NifU family Fe-S cluster assembly protein [Oligoflexia bacterium]
MNSELKSLYQEVIIDHSKRPRNFKKIDNFNKEAEGFNPLCGDRLNLYLKTDGNKIIDASFQGQGCAISTASASMLTEIIKGKSVDEALKLFEMFHALVTTGGAPKDETQLGKLAVFAGVHEFPARVKCASLSWHTLKMALLNKTDVAKTE